MNEQSLPTANGKPLEDFKQVSAFSGLYFTMTKVTGSHSNLL